MQTGNIGVTTENIFPIIKKFLYSDHEIFLRELVSNAVDASQKMKALARTGEFTGELGDLKVWVELDKEAKTITIRDRGIGMTAEEIEKYINQIAFSSANDFLDQYKDKVDAIIGHFGLGFYSSFMVSKKVEIITLSHKEGAQAVRWSCEGNPEFVMEDTHKDDRGTDIILHIDDENLEFVEKNKLDELLSKYCKFLAVPVVFGKKTKWADGKEQDTEEDNQINDTDPAWRKKPVDLKDEDYKDFYKKLYPGLFEEPLFHIHLNVDYPFNLTGILYFPRLKTNLDIQKNKIQLYSNQVFVTDSVEGIVPDYLGLLHGVLDSPDIPLNVSRSYLQSDSNVKKISSHITKKVADRLHDIFKNEREKFETKWDDLKLFITYGVLSDPKFHDRASKFVLLKNTEGKFFTLEEYNEAVKANQTNKQDQVIYLYATDTLTQHTFIDAAKAKGYDVLHLNGQLDIHLINHLESKLDKVSFKRVDADVIDKLIAKDEAREVALSQDQIDLLRPVFESSTPENGNYSIQFENLGEDGLPVILTQSEFMRRMKDLSAMSGSAMGFYGDLPDSYNLVVNTNHALIRQMLELTQKEMGGMLQDLDGKKVPVSQQIQELEARHKDMKDEEIPQAEKDQLDELHGKASEFDNQRRESLFQFGRQTPVIKQVIDLALLSNNMLKGPALTEFVKRSVKLIGN